MDEDFSVVRVPIAEASAVAAHPKENAFCVGSRGGELECYTWKLSPGAAAFVELLSGWDASHEPEEIGDDDVRGVAYTSDGEHVVSVNASGGIMVTDSTTGQLVHEAVQEANPLHSLMCIDPSTFATGDESGTVQVWDQRIGSWKEQHSFADHDDYVSCLSLRHRDRTLLSTSGDGTMAVYDLRKGALMQQSDPDEDELLSCVVVKHGRKVVAGSQEGVLKIFSWGHFEDSSDRFPGHPDTIDCIVPFDEDTIITGGGDGGLRVLSILPNKLLGVVGDLGSDQVQDMALSCDKRVLATTSDSDYVQLWSLDALHDDDDDGGGEDEKKEEHADGGGEDSEDEKPAKRAKAGSKMPNTKSKKTAGKDQNFFNDLL